MWGIYFSKLVASFPFFLKGLWMTIAVSGLSIVLGTMLGFLSGILRANRVPVIYRVLALYVDVMRGTPFLVQIFIIFFVLPSWGLHLEAFTAAVLSLTIYAGAYISEIVASAIEAVPPGQSEAAMSGGLNIYQRLRYVVLPQALPTMLPPLVGHYVLMIKDSSVVSVIGVTDVTRVGWLTVQRIPEGLMVFGLVGILYFAVCFPLIRLVQRLEKHMRLGEFRL